MVHALGIGYFAVVVALGYAQLFARGARPHPTYRRTLIGLVLLASPAVLLDAFGDRAGISALTADRRAEFLWPWTVWTVAATLAFWFAAIIGRKLAARPIDEAWRRASATRTQDRRKLCALAIFAGVTEEFFMRGYFLALLVTVTGSALAALSSVTLVFGLLHHYRGGAGCSSGDGGGYGLRHFCSCDWHATAGDRRTCWRESGVRYLERGDLAPMEVGRLGSSMSRPNVIEEADGVPAAR